MKYLTLLTVLLGTVLTGCAQHNVPQGDIVSLEYTRSGTMAGHIYMAYVTRDSLGAYTLEAMPKDYADLRKRSLSRKEMDSLRTIVIEEKMYAYKERYTPIMPIMDGYSWRLVIKFSDGKRIYSSGSNAVPRGDGIQRLRDYLAQLAQKE